VWSLGVVLYEAIAGTLPYAGLSGDEVLSRLADLVMPDVRESTPTCPANLAEFLRKALSPDSSRRWATAAEFRQQLQRIRDDFRSVHQPI
jgi:serine/threonine-protein kinase